MGYILCNFSIPNTIVGAGAGTASCYGSGSEQMMRILAAKMPHPPPPTPPESITKISSHTGMYGSVVAFLVIAQETAQNFELIL
jgi:hypothetical protein